MKDEVADYIDPHGSPVRLIAKKDSPLRAIITFHGIDDRETVLSYAPKLFGCFLDALVDSEIPVHDLDALLDPRTQNGVALTFDDGMVSVFSEALPRLRDHGMPAHLFLTTGAVGGDNQWPGQSADAQSSEMLDWDQVEALHDAGVRVEGHTITHPDLRSLSLGQIRDECQGADEEIGSRLGRPPAYFAYPYGFHDARSRDFVRTHYKGGVTTELRSLRRDCDPASLPRLDSYYLQNRFLYGRLDAGRTRAYLAARDGLRKLKDAIHSVVPVS
jgi:peptidoglycan/xylan/chitin deacetylase (PgdA/CDA1 family)